MESLDNLEGFGRLVKADPAYAKDIFVEGMRQSVINSIIEAGDPQAVRRRIVYNESGTPNSRS